MKAINEIVYILFSCHQNLARFQEVHLNSDATFLSEILHVHLQFVRFILKKRKKKNHNQIHKLKLFQT